MPFHAGPSRRLARYLAFAMALSIIGKISAQAPSFTLRQVGPQIWAAISNPASKAAAGANSGFIIGDDAVIVIDASASIDADGYLGTQPAEQLLTAIRKVTNLPVRYVVSTHHHIDHVGGNGTFVNAGATVLAHRNVRAWMESENLRMFGTQIRPLQKAFIEALPSPTITYAQALHLYLGARQVHVLSMPGHTGGDSVVVIPDAKVIFAGDLFWRNTLPNLMDATTVDWIDTLTVLEKDRADWTFVPGHGEVGTTVDVAAFRHYLATLRKLVLDARATGKSGEALAGAVMPVLKGEYGRWDADSFEYFAKQNIHDMESELNGNKRIPEPTRDR